MGCDNTAKILRKRGWSFPPLADCRAAWEKRYPKWPWRDTTIIEWRAEETDDDLAAAVAAGPREVVNNGPSVEEMAAAIAGSPEAITASIAAGYTKF
jgi:hypothetical protein